MDSIDISLLEWLNLKWSPDDISILPWTLAYENPVEYMPIPTVRQKIEFMRKHFKVKVTQTEVNIGTETKPGKEPDLFVWATVKYKLEHSDFDGGVYELCGTASLFAGQYKGSWSLAQIAESLATTRAFSKDWPQFGKGLNETEDPMKDMSSPSAKPSLSSQSAFAMSNLHKAVKADK